MRFKDIMALMAAGAAVILVGMQCQDKGSEPDNEQPNQAPQITSAGSATAFVDVRFIYRATAHDPDGTTPATSFSDYPSWLDTAEAVISGIPETGNADTFFTVIASDGALADTLTVAVAVRDTSTTPNQKPVVTSPDTASAMELEHFYYLATAVDPDGTTPTITYANYPFWMTPEEADSLHGHAPLDAADTSFQVIASDGLLSDTLLVSVTIIHAPDSVSYINQVQPIFTANCAITGCHAMGPGAQAELRLHSYMSLMQGSISGDVIIPFQPDSSILIKQIEGTRLPQMPFGQPPLPDSLIHSIRTWVSQGALNN
jgi:hypothetical protein